MARKKAPAKAKAPTRSAAKPPRKKTKSAAASPSRSKAASAPQAPPALPVYRRTPADGLQALSSHEWLLTSGIGGFAMGTPLGTPTRRYHGLLVAATVPPVGRVVALNAMCEWAFRAGDDQRFDLAAFQWADGGAGRDVDPPALPHFDSFERDLEGPDGGVARWRWRLGDDVILTRELTLVEGANIVELRYTAAGGGPGVRVQANPLISLRDFHSVIHEHDNPDRFQFDQGEQSIAVRTGDLALHISAAGADSGVRFHEEPAWWRNFFYTWEQRRGQDCIEDLWRPGYFEFTVPQSKGRSSRPVTLRAELIVGNAAPINRPPPRTRAKRLKQLAAAAVAAAEAGSAGELGEPERAAVAAMAAGSDDFIVRRAPVAGAGKASRGAKGEVSIIAGYPWFSDWGRDTMICIPGLLLSTGRHAEALSTLRAFARHRRNGIIPNRFDDHTGGAHYNTVDASLWFLHACAEYARAAADTAGFVKHLWPACSDIIDAYSAGTDFNIGLDDDGLIFAGDEHTQLTWMDAQHHGVVFTPRHGKCVEINALWFNGLSGIAGILEQAKKKKEREALLTTARRCATSFRRFWCADHLAAAAGDPSGGGWLYDRLEQDHAGHWLPAHEFRPNQILAASLPHSPIGRDRARAVVQKVREHLLTPHGLRTLHNSSPNYRRRFTGPLPQLDAAYHNGTAWPWLLGPLAEAVMRVKGFSPASKREAREIIRPVIERMDCECPGHIAEVFDAEDTPEAPQQPGGCPAQAWSLAEALRISILAAGG